MSEHELALAEACKIIRLSADHGVNSLNRTLGQPRRRLTLRALPEDVAPPETASGQGQGPAEPPPPIAASSRPSAELRWILGLTAVTALAATAAMAFTGLQWWDAHQGAAKTEGLAAQGLAAAAQIQANAARDAVAVAREQAAISRDMLALSQKSAEAQQKAASASVAAVTPLLEAQALDLSGLLSAPGKDGKVRLNLRYRFANTGHVTGYLKGVSTALYIGKDLPPVPAYDPATASSMELPTGSAVMNATPVAFARPAADVRDVIAGRKTAYVVGYVDYLDTSNASHRLCFAYALDIKGRDASQGFAPAGPDAYRCGA